MLARLGLPDAFHTLFHTLFPYVSYILPLCFEGIYWGGLFVHIAIYMWKNFPYPPTTMPQHPAPILLEG